MQYPYNRERQKQVMTVIGQGSIEVTPDQFQIQMEVITEDESLQSAQQQNAQKMNQVIQSIVQWHIPKENIQTTAYTITPRYDYVEGKQVFRGYEVVNAIRVILEDASQAGGLIDQAVASGINHISSLQFTVQNHHVFYQQALSNAIVNAIGNAQTIAETLQLHLHPEPVKIKELVSEGQIHPMAFSLAEKSVTTPIISGQVNITARVEVQFSYE
ncbi:SIMPL domain-containing protein [Virgibacillus sp. LDC-1]|uniref:SIMPL domain-containing protein n=1 Tax=Virgibacillus sp. LDC-1 TaxID=3039856 RepID=UPI0024DEDF3C|nr:SIMPL domain-containing protein [Virgibacillus sp. LDC-1]